jgi:hypothetical protein
MVYQLHKNGISVSQLFMHISEHVEVISIQIGYRESASCSKDSYLIV